MTLPLLDTDRLPAFSAITPDGVTPVIDALLARNRAAVAGMADQTAPDWRSLPARLEALDDDLSRAWALVSHPWTP